ncbi:C-C motif chemokine 3-like [Betta splendens]|uniref:C-C motif chemokine 3-like n=1 Tax=Betta splendens TaxID=158456 RepID=A0A8M1HBJ8_BETSP|nr:C-C motif chemokine 3-like [Betta splendens]
MKTGRILLLCILAAALVSTVVCNNVRGPDVCCWSYHPWRIKKDLIQSYILTNEKCLKPGVILVTVKSRHICVDPNLSWVEDIMELLDERLIK